MSGHVPEFIKKGGYVTYLGIMKKVVNYYFTSSDTPYIPNTDQLILVFERGEKVKYNYETVKPMKGKRG